MATKHHFVVVGEVDTNGRISFAIDHDTADIAFPEGTIWDEQKFEWVRVALKDVEGLDTMALDIAMTDALASALEKSEVSK